MYTCPMHPEVRQEGPGTCPKCGMALVAEGAPAAEAAGALRVHGDEKRSIRDFLPLIIIFIIIFALTAGALWWRGGLTLYDAMRFFEGFFFVTFGVFKLLNWRGFVDAYQTYDLIAKRSRAYGYAYPLVELALGAAYLADFAVLTVAWITLVVMLIGAAGVWRELRKNNQIPCACLGVVFKIPMTWVTFIEDVAMAAMAAAMIFLML